MSAQGTKTGMTDPKPWFTNRGQMLQLAVAVIVSIVTFVVAWPSIKSSEL
jgi:hypothetical protein